MQGPPRRAEREKAREAWLIPESACIEEYNEEDKTATVHLEYISDLIEPAFVEIDLKRGKVRLIFTRCEDAANRYDFNSKFNDNVKTL